MFTVSFQIPSAVAVRMPSVKQIGNTIARQRRLSGIPSTKPNSLKELVIPNNFKEIETPTEKIQFLQFDSGPDHPNRFLIFCTLGNLKLLKHCENVYADGTFSVTPPLFEP